MPVASYTNSKKTAAERTVLRVDKQSAPAPAISGGDVERKAVAFDRCVVNRMTPTMKRFTLEGKVAVVTG